MIVNLKFDTEKDSIEDFRKLRAYVEEIIAEKEGSAPKADAQGQDAQRKRTQGGCRVIPYQDLSDELFSLCSKRKK